SAPKWLGRCPDCGGWNTISEEAARPEPAHTREQRTFRLPGAIGEDSAPVLVGGDPGIGKSTLLLQALSSLARTQGPPALYVTGEESKEQVKLRAERLGISGERVLLLAETRADRVAA